MTQREIQQYVYDFLYDKGLPHNTICGIMGNITGESGWDVNCIESGNSIGFGLCQWSFGRRTQLENYGTDLGHQCEFLWSELTGENTSVTGAEPQWIANPADSVTPDTSYSFQLSDFLAGKGTIAELTTAWCYCWERPAYSTNHLDRRITSAEDFASYMTYSGTEQPDENARKIGNAVKWAIDTANDDSHGYDQTNRWGPDYDCSSFIITAFNQAGINYNATYTGDMLESALQDGFEVYDFDVSILQVGDIILKSGHVVLYIGNGEIVHASINENGEITGGQTGDQTGKEICVRSFYNDSWKYIIRYPHTGTVDPNNPDKPHDPDNPHDPDEKSVYDLICETFYPVKTFTSEQVEILDNLYIGDKCLMKFTFNHNKRQIGANHLGKRLTFTTFAYTIKEVRKNGFVKIGIDDIAEYNIINPKYIKESDKT